MGLGLGRGEPHRTAPHALGAEGQRGGHLPTVADATGGQHRHRGDGVDDLGDQHHRADLAGVPAGLVALGDHEVDAGGDVAHGVRRLAGERGDLDALGVGPLDHVGRRRAERVDDQLDRVGEGHVHQRHGLVVGHRCGVVAADRRGESSSTSGGTSYRRMMSSTKSRCPCGKNRINRQATNAGFLNADGHIVPMKETNVADNIGQVTARNWDTICHVPSRKTLANAL